MHVAPYLSKSLPVSLILASSLLIGCGKKDAVEAEPVVQPVKVVTVGGERSELSRDLPGTVRSSKRVNLAFQVQGRLVEFPMKEGQEVEEGQLLAKLDDRDYRSSVSAARAEVVKNKANFERAKDLLKKNFISQAEYDRLKAALDVSVANQEKAEKALEDSRLIAPFSGTVARTYVENFEDVRAKEQILSLQDKRSLEIVVDVSETIIARRSETAEIKATAKFDAIADRNFDLYIKEFSTEANEETQTFQYVLGIEGDTATILPGMTANVTVARVGDSFVDNSFVLPISAIVAGENDQASVWRLSDKNHTRVHQAYE